MVEKAVAICSRNRGTMTNNQTMYNHKGAVVSDYPMLLKTQVTQSWMTNPKSATSKSKHQLLFLRQSQKNTKALWLRRNLLVMLRIRLRLPLRILPTLGRKASRCPVRTPLINKATRSTSKYTTNSLRIQIKEMSATTTQPLMATLWANKKGFVLTSRNCLPH